MKTYEGILRKMQVEASKPVKYYLNFEQSKILMNDFLGKKIKILFSDEIHCIKCGIKIKKTYGEGFCYKCFITAPEADKCIIRPELCQAHLGISRDMEWSKKNCLTTHYVYLALTDHLKVGVTRENQIPNRWIDQGAAKVIKLAETPYRQLAGLIEVDLKKHFSDKTNWQKMLKNEIIEADLEEEKRKALSLLSPQFKQYISLDNQIFEFEYPLLEIPQKIKSLSLDKQKEIQGILTGIKGQYLIFDNSFVFNVRKFTGYKVKIIID